MVTTKSVVVVALEGELIRELKGDNISDSDKYPHFFNDIFLQSSICTFDCVFTCSQ